MTINTQKLRDLLAILKDDGQEGKPQFQAAQKIMGAVPALLDHIDAQQAEIDRYRRASERWKKVAESAEERVRDQAAEIAVQAQHANFLNTEIARLRGAIQGLLDALPSATTHPAVKAARDALKEANHD